MGMCSTSPLVNTHTLRPHSHQVHTYPLWGCNPLPTGRFISPCTHWYKTLRRSLFTCVSTSVNIWGSSLFSSSLLVMLYRLLKGLRLQTLFIIIASTHSIATHIVSTLCWTLDNHQACSCTSSIANCRPLWVCSLTATKVPKTYWCVLSIF